MSRRTDSGTWAVILRRLVASRVNKPPVSLSKIIKHHSDKKQFDKDIAVIVATVTDDERILEIPKMNIAALKFTEAARARITKAGGVCMTLDELVKKCPTGKYKTELPLPEDVFDSEIATKSGFLVFISLFNYKGSVGCRV